MLMKKSTTLTLIILGPTLLSACGPSDNSAEAERVEAYAAKHGIEVDVEVGNSGEEKVVMERNLGTGVGQYGSNLDVPDDFPDDFPVHPGMNIHSVADMGVGKTIQAQVNKDADAIAEFYIEELEENGWTREAAESPVSALQALRFTNNGRVANLTLMPGGQGKTVVQIVVLKAQQ